MKSASLTQFLQHLQQRDPHQPEFLQAVHEVYHSLWPFIEKHPEYADYGLLERLTEPDRIYQFRVTWVDDQGKIHINRAFRVQHNNAIGPYKGGMRFHPSVNLSILKFLAFEQTFKNALTTLPMGGAKGGSDFDPKGKSDLEIMRFCQALVTELYPHIGADMDVPAGDIGVGAREVGFMAGMMKKLTRSAECVFTGKGFDFGGSFIRPEATGYGLVYFVLEMLATQQKTLDGLRVAISGAGNVAQYAAKKCLDLGATVLTMSDSSGTVYDETGITPEKLAILMECKNQKRLSLQDYAHMTHSTFLAGERPWHIPVDVALPCATQNELDINDAKQLIQNGVICVAEGANMPTTLQAIAAFQQANILYAPGKASNAGGVAVSGLEMCQGAQRLQWAAEDVDNQLLLIMKRIHASCAQYGRHNQKINYVEGANIAGFVKVANAMLAQGIY